jgi:hypothetical protein
MIRAEKRQHKRFPVRDGRLAGRLDRTHTVDIVDMSAGGAALRAGRRLTAGREYTMRFGSLMNSVEVQGVIIRSRLLSSEEAFHGARVFVYSAAMQFREGSEDRITDFICDAILA